MSRTILLKCKKCGKKIEKESREYNRQIRNGRAKDDFYCGLSCAAKSNANYKNCGISGIVATQKPFDPIQYILTIVKNRTKRSKDKSKYDTCDLTIEYLKNLWNAQDGKCALSGIPIQLVHKKAPNTPTTASLDRIDSAKGYVEGNVQFVAYSLNLAKSSFTNADMMKFLAELKV